MNKVKWRLPWILGVWLISNCVIAAHYEYQVLWVTGEDLQKTLNENGKDGWRLTSTNMWTDDCHSTWKKCFVLVFERGVN